MESNQYDVLASSTSIEKPWTKETSYLVRRAFTLMKENNNIKKYGIELADLLLFHFFKPILIEITLIGFTGCSALISTFSIFSTTSS